MKNFKRFISIVFVLILCICLCACGSDKKDIVGSWAGTWEFKGNQISCSIVLDENGEYSKTTLKNGVVSGSETGTWELKNEELHLHENGDLLSSTVYYYKNGKVIHIGMEGTEDEFVKQGK